MREAVTLTQSPATSHQSHLYYIGDEDKSGSAGEKRVSRATHATSESTSKNAQHSLTQRASGFERNESSRRDCSYGAVHQSHIKVAQLGDWKKKAKLRLQRWAYFLSGYKYKVEIVKSKANGNCDALSRLPIDDSTLVFETEYTHINYVEEECPMVDFQAVKRALGNDKTLRKIISYTQADWPKTTELSEIEKTFYTKRHELSYENGCLSWGHRIVIPEILQNKILQAIHSSHLGIVKMKHIARNYFWWPNIDVDIENLANSCSNCLESRPYPTKTPLTTWLWPSQPWSRIHMDFAKFNDSMFLIAIDAHSKWPIVVNMKNDTTAKNLIKEIDSIFANKGYPDHIVSDNGTQFTSNEFASYLRKFRIKHTFSAPFYPATNGAAENFVKTFKDKVKKIMKDGHSLEFSLNRFLADYRNTPHCSTGVSPAQLMYKRKLKTRFDLIVGDTRHTVEAHQFDQHRFTHGNRHIEFLVGDIVYARDYRKDTPENARAITVTQSSPAMYTVKFADGFITKRHVNQIVRTALKPQLDRGESEALGNNYAYDNSISNEREDSVNLHSKKCKSANSSVSASKEKVKRKRIDGNMPGAVRRSPRLANNVQQSN
ncbi:PREDICTED: uncharacterized protein K02A2.6-like [Vollenhovia emeryi]|uniref:uncharacterized protein K02A2.6-like n=1 Tax=Vollenhovia emeryi TaxID=411798 RepID=UPI0005F41583|nr:PREDICTED: uncharacterized protein K02A2.6-like [Vollenhovia emeryi]